MLHKTPANSSSSLETYERPPSKPLQIHIKDLLIQLRIQLSLRHQTEAIAIQRMIPKCGDSNVQEVGVKTLPQVKQRTGIIIVKNNLQQRSHKLGGAAKAGRR